jgi:hypothetical protein
MLHYIFLSVVAVCRVIIKGTTEQIALAKSLIEEKVMQSIGVRENIQETLDRRSPRKRMGPQYLMSAEAFEVCLTMLKHQRTCRKLLSVMMHLSDLFERPESYSGSHLV